jgi:hypothetical protein
MQKMSKSLVGLWGVRTNWNSGDPKVDHFKIVRQMPRDRDQANCDEQQRYLVQHYLDDMLGLGELDVMTENQLLHWCRLYDDMEHWMRECERRWRAEYERRQRAEKGKRKAA